MLHVLRLYTLLLLTGAGLMWGQGTAGGQSSTSNGPGAAAPTAAEPRQVSTPNVPAVFDAGNDPLSAAIIHYGRGEFAAAIESYNLVLQKNPKSPDAYAGLTRVYLKQKQVDRAFDMATQGLKVTDSQVLHVALGEVYFRQGLIPEAEREWVKVINQGYPSARAYLGLAKIRSVMSLYAQAKELLNKAHDLDPTDRDIQRNWIRSLSRAEQIKFWEDYLASPTNDDAETRIGMEHHLAYLRALQNEPPHACRLVTQIPSTETQLERILTDPRHLRGYALAVALNGKKGRFMFDTGASGILVDQSLAKKAGITAVSEIAIGGIGDKPRPGGFNGFAKSIRIGELEFQDCRVSVIEKRSVLGDDGLIGGDVFSHFLVDIDFPQEKLRLSPLPRRPDEKAPEVTLQTAESAVPGGEAPSDRASPDIGAKTSPSTHRGPRDRYIAPEMESYARVYRFGHNLLVPTRIGDQPPRLFLLDTGSSHNMMSLRSAQEATKVHDNPQMHVNGLNGSVAKVYRADQVVLTFGHLRQENQDITAFDLSHMSDNIGTELTGILGFNTLGLLDIRIDYRDGLVDFTYKPRP